MPGSSRIEAQFDGTAHQCLIHPYRQRGVRLKSPSFPTGAFSTFFFPQHPPKEEFLPDSERQFRRPE